MLSIVQDEKRYPHKAPLGYLNFEKPDGTKDIKIDEILAPVIKEVFEKYATRTYSLEELTRIFSSRGISGPRGGKVSVQSVRNILTNEFYIGEKFEYGASKTHAIFNHEQIVTKELFYRVQNVINKRSNNSDKPRTIRNPEFPLRQFIRCHECNGFMTGYNATGRKGVRFPYYKCYNKNCSHQKSYPRDNVHELFTQYLSQFIPSEESYKKFRTAFIKEWEQLQSNATQSISLLEENLKRLKDEKVQISKLAKGGAYTPEEAREEFEQSRNEIMISEIALNDARTDFVEADVLIDEAVQIFRNISEIWLNADVEGKRKLQFLLFPQGVVFQEEDFSNRQLCPAIALIRDFEANNSNMG